jgi:hypothetical protein
VERRRPLPAVAALTAALGLQNATAGQLDTSFLGVSLGLAGVAAAGGLVPGGLGSVIGVTHAKPTRNPSP